jgi:hypothetical protein
MKLFNRPTPTHVDEMRWKPIFAWVPVRVSDTERVWLETVEARTVTLAPHYKGSGAYRAYGVKATQYRAVGSGSDGYPMYNYLSPFGMNNDGSRDVQIRTLRRAWRDRIEGE